MSSGEDEPLSGQADFMEGNIDILDGESSIDLDTSLMNIQTRLNNALNQSMDEIDTTSLKLDLSMVNGSTDDNLKQQLTIRVT